MAKKVAFVPNSPCKFAKFSYLVSFFAEIVPGKLKKFPTLASSVTRPKATFDVFRIQINQVGIFFCPWVSPAMKYLRRNIAFFDLLYNHLQSTRAPLQFGSSNISSTNISRTIFSFGITICLDICFCKLFHFIMISFQESKIH